MRIISQNVTNYGIEVSKDTIFRINLAWCNSIDELKAMLQKHRDNKIFLDLPIKRIKTPNNRYTLDDLIPIISSYQQIKYFAISNVESPDDLAEYIKKIPKKIVLVPKIESSSAIHNISDIVNTIPTDEKVLMLDHDDLFSSSLNITPIVRNKMIVFESQKSTSFCI